MASSESKAPNKKNSNKHSKSLKLAVINFLKGHRIATIFLVFAVIGGLTFVYRAFAATDIVPQTNQWEYTANNGRLKLGAEGMCNFTTQFVGSSVGKVASVKCDVRDEGFRDVGWVDATDVQLGAWSAGKQYQACFWVSPDTPVGSWAKARKAVSSFRIDMLQGEDWGDTRRFDVGYDTRARYTFDEYCTFKITTNGNPRNLQVRVWSINDSSFRVSRIVLKEFTPSPGQSASDKNPQTVAPSSPGK